MHGDTTPSPRLERSRGDWVRVAAGAGAGVERLEARFHGEAYSPHRHDTLAIGLTLEGVQCFRFRGALRHATPGNTILLPPDELHDGHAGSEHGFRYRMLYLDPDALRRAGGGRLHLVEGGVLRAPDLASAVGPALADLDVAVEPLAESALLTDVADALARRATGTTGGEIRRVDESAVATARALLLENLEHGVALSTLETAVGRSRYSLNRHFRAACGVSPHRWLVQRRLDRVRTLMSAGASAADAALRAGFADQSHMTRHFRAAYGMSPGRWQQHTTGVVAAAGADAATAPAQS